MLERPVTLLIDSQELESGEALSNQFRKLAGPEIDAFKSDLAVADQCIRGCSVDVARRRRRSAWLRSDAQGQHALATRAFVVPPGLHALRSTAHNA